ncbi:MAG: DNA polymerase III subunit beta [bacterium]|nr:DNA polymerase III subunit beta [bacterium]
MTLEILQENLIKGLSLVTRVTTGKIQMPILGNVLLETVDGQLKLSGTNLEISLNTVIGAKIITEGSFTVPSRTLTEIIAALPPGKIILELKEGQLIVISGKFSTKINGIPASEWPAVTKIENKNNQNIKIDFSKFKELVSKTIISVGTDEARPALTGILVKSNGEELIMVATDGFRLSQTRLAVKSPDFSIIVPSKAMLEVSKMDGKSLEIEIGSNDAVFTIDDAVLTARLIAGNFPAYEKIIPQSSENSLIIDAVDLLKSVKLAGVFARDSANIVKFGVQNDKLVIKSQAQQTGENQSEVEIKLEKQQEEELIIAFNYHYLLDLLNIAGDHELKFSFTNSLTAGLFEIIGDKDFLHLIMPVRVQS